MIGLLQRVATASVSVDGAVVGAIGRGLLVLVGVQRDDSEAQAMELLARLLEYRVFPDAAGRMNVALQDLPDAGLLLVPQFTLAADTRSGRRPGFSAAAPPATAHRLYERLLALAQACQAMAGRVASGPFGAHMQVHLVNDGPVTFWLETRHPPPGNR